MEPRLGEVGEQPGEEKQLPLGVGYLVSEAYQKLAAYMQEHKDRSTARFLIQHPELRGIIRRIQTMSQSEYGEIRANLLSQDMLPVHLLRAKHAFFGSSRFDPRSKFWVQITMFQGAPLLDELQSTVRPEWFMPILPSIPNIS